MSFLDALASAAITGQLGPGKPKPKPPSAFVTDTLAPLLGGPFTLYGGRGPSPTPAQRRRGEQSTGLTTQSGDTVYVYDESPDSAHTLNHEAGHVWSQRKVAPTVWTQILQANDEAKQDKGYASTNESEYAAETFARGLEHMKTPGADLLAAEKDWPGITPVVEWMRTRKPFAK